MCEDCELLFEENKRPCDECREERPVSELHEYHDRFLCEMCFDVHTEMDLKALED